MFNQNHLLDKIIRLANQIAETGLNSKTAMKIAIKTVYKMEVFARELRNADWK